MNGAVRRATIVGAGGIGCAIGHALGLGGFDLTVVEVDPAKLEWGKTHGIRIDDGPAVAARFIPFDEWAPTAAEPILLATKCYDNRAVLDRLPPDAEIIPVQNGYDENLVDRAAFEGIASFVSECRPGRTHTRITRPGDLHIGRSTPTVERLVPPRLEELIGTLDRHAVFTVRRVSAVLPYKNAKLLYNAAISPIAAVAGLDNGQLLTLTRARTLFFGLLQENYRILRDAGSPMARIGPFHPDTVYRILRVPVLARAMTVPFARTLRGTYCSMAGDLPHGPTELDNYNGRLLRLAGERTPPLNREVYRVARFVEEQGFEPSLRWLNEIVDAVSS